MTALKKVTRIAYKREPQPGERGERGAIQRHRKFVTGVEYQCGAEGEEFLDYAYYDGVWYKCLITHTPTGDRNPFDDIGHGIYTWEVVSNFSSLATECAIVGSDGNGWILTEGQITHTSGKVILKSDGSINVNNKCKISPDGSINVNDKCVITSEGVLTSKGGVFEGRLQLPFKLHYGGTLDVTDGTAMLLRGHLELPNSAAFNGWVLEIWGNPFFTKSDIPASISGNIYMPSDVQGKGMYVATYIYLHYGGYMRLVCMNGKWIMTNIDAPSVEKEGAYKDLVYLF